MSKKIQNESKPLIVPNEIISAEEYRTRAEAWRVYYEKCRETRAFQRFQEMREAFKEKKVDLIRKLRDEAREQYIAGDFIPKPPFEDPDIQKQQGRLGVKEYWEQEVKIAMESDKEVVFKNEDVKEQLSISPDF